MRKLKFRRLPGVFGICRLPPDTPVPSWSAETSGFCSVTRTRDELSVVTELENIPPEHTNPDRWTCFKLHGPFAFSEVGILASFVQPLVAAQIPIFAVSTFDTDYVLINQENIDAALKALREAGHQLLSD